MTATIGKKKRATGDGEEGSIRQMLDELANERNS